MIITIPKLAMAQSTYNRIRATYTYNDHIAYSKIYHKINTIADYDIQEYCFKALKDEIGSMWFRMLQNSVEARV